MSLASMTGFASHAASHGGRGFLWEIKSVNGKGLDLRLKLPPGFEGLDAALREAASAGLRRGSVQASLQWTGEGAERPVRVNEAALAAVLELVDGLRARLAAPPPAIEGLLALPGILETGGAEAISEADKAARDAAVLQAFRACLAGLVAARQAEGAKLRALMAGHVDRIASLAAAARDCPGRSLEAQKRKLAEQLEKLMGQGLDEQRLHQEAVILIQRVDVQEEIDRLFAHVAAARALLEGSEPAGRKLDFLSQEFNREANTLCAKSNDVALTAIGLELKATIDQFREQVQNIE